MPATLDAAGYYGIVSNTENITRGESLLSQVLQELQRHCVGRYGPRLQRFLASPDALEIQGLLGFGAASEESPPLSREARTIVKAHDVINRLAVVAGSRQELSQVSVGQLRVDFDRAYSNVLHLVSPRASYTEADFMAKAG